MADIATLRANNAQFWAQTAPGWVRQADRHDRLGRPLGASAMDWLRPRLGERVLDVGCGCGGTTAEIAEAVGPGGTAVGVDLSEVMVAAAAQRFPADRYPGLRFVSADVEAIDAAPASPFDAAYSRMTIMLLADPVAGCATIRRSLRPGGRFAVTTFRDAGAAPWLAAVLLGAAPHVGPLPPLPVGDDPGPFAFADPARVRRILTAAGFDRVTVATCDVTMDAPDDPETVAEWLIELGPASGAYQNTAPAGQAAARAGAARLLERFRHPGIGYRLPSGHWLITAINPT